MIVAALAAKGVPHAYLPFEGEQHGFRKAENIVRALEAELRFYGQVFGFDPGRSTDRAGRHGRRLDDPVPLTEPVSSRLADSRPGGRAGWLDGTSPGHREDRRGRPRPAAGRRPRRRRPARPVARRAASTRSPAPHALIIRSATTVTAEVLDAGTDLVVVGRAGIGLDNVDVAARHHPRRHGRQRPAVEHPVHGRAHDGACCWPRPATSPRPTPPWWTAAGSGRSGRASSSPTRRSASSASAASASWWPSGRWRSACRSSPTTRSSPPERARQMNIELVDLDTSSPPARTSSRSTSSRRPRRSGSIGKEFLAKAKPNLRIVNVSRGGIVDEEALAEAIREGRVAGAALDVFASEPTTESPLFELPSVVVTPHLGASTREAQDKAGDTIAEQVELALAGEFVPFAVERQRRRGRRRRCARSSPLAERLGGLFAVARRGRARPARDRVPGPAGRLRHPHPHPVGAEGRVRHGSARSRCRYVNAPQLAAERGVEVRDIDAPRRPATTSTSSPSAAATTHIAGTLSRPAAASPASCMVDDHIGRRAARRTTCWWSATTTARA